jgi:hypothetical protein
LTIFFLSASAPQRFFLMYRKLTQKGIDRLKVFLIAVTLLLNGSCKSKDNTGPGYQEPVVVGKANVWLTRGDKTKLLNYEGELDITKTLSVSWPVVTIDTTRQFRVFSQPAAAENECIHPRRRAEETVRPD